MKPTSSEIHKARHNVAEIEAEKDRVAQDISMLLEKNSVVDGDLIVAKDILKALEILEKRCGLNESKI